MGDKAINVALLYACVCTYMHVYIQTYMQFWHARSTRSGEVCGENMSYGRLVSNLLQHKPISTYIYVCMYIYIYIYTYIHMHVCICSPPPPSTASSTLPPQRATAACPCGPSEGLRRGGYSWAQPAAPVGRSKQTSQAGGKRRLKKKYSHHHCKPATLCY